MRRRKGAGSGKQRGATRAASPGRRLRPDHLYLRQARVGQQSGRGNNRGSSGRCRNAGKNSGAEGQRGCRDSTRHDPAAGGKSGQSGGRQAAGHPCRCRCGQAAGKRRDRKRSRHAHQPEQQSRPQKPAASRHSLVYHSGAAFVHCCRKKFTAPPRGRASPGQRRCGPCCGPLLWRHTGPGPPA